MSKTEKLIILIINTLLCSGAIVLTATLMQGWGVLVSIICYALPCIGFVVGIVAFALNKQVILKSCVVVMVCIFMMICAIAVTSKIAHLEQYKTDEEKIKKLTELIRNTGEWGMVVFVVIQILQVVILPIPAVVCYVPGSQIWGAGIATLLASLGVVIGSTIAYCIGKFFGRKAVVWIAGKETTEKYINYIGNRGKIIFILMQVLPFFPDDILCMIAGLTAMSFPFFIITIILVRPLVIILYCYLGEGTIIPFHGWGIPVWITIFVVAVVLAILSFKYQDKVEKWLFVRFKRKKKDSEAKEEDNTTE